MRSKATDVVDVWRCLEVCFVAGTAPSQFDGKEGATAVALTRELFRVRNGSGMSSLVTEQRLSTRAADDRYTRIRALIDRVIAWA